MGLAESEGFASLVRDFHHDNGTGRGAVQRGTYWMLRFGLGFDEARPGNIVLTDGDLNVLAGDGMSNPGNRFHLWIYRERRARSSRTRCATSRRCCSRTMVSSPPPRRSRKRQCSRSYVERAARLQLMARAAGEIKRIDPELALEARKFRGSQKYLAATFDYLARRVLRETPDLIPEDRNMKPLIRGLCTGLLILVVASASAAYPDKPIRIVVPYPPGGGADVTARPIAQKLSELWACRW